jgi:dTDP-4-dehydrorhamnose reductase
MRILVTGADGLVGRALVARGACAAGDTVIGAGRSEGDVCDPRVRELLLDRHAPDAVIFCAAFTAVDRAGAPGEVERARAVNVVAPGAWARRVPTWWLSSNFVFDGPGPHAPWESPGRTPRASPVGAYAGQKAEGEEAVREAGGNVCRVGWVYGPGGKTFGSTLVRRLVAGETVAAIADVIVQPTLSTHLAESLLRLPPGVSHHIGCETTSWFGFALAVQARVGSGRVVAVRLDELHLPEPRPRDARLTPATLPGWRAGVEELLRLETGARGV